MKKSKDEFVLYGIRGSGSAAAELGLRACGLPYRVVRAASWEADSAVAELAKVNPLKQIPTLVMPGGTVMSESAAILIHLGLQHPQSGLLPFDEARRAMALRGLVFVAANCYSAISISDYPERWTTSKDKADHDAIRQGTRATLHRHWELFADMMGTPAPFLSGDVPGAVDFLAAVVSRWSGTRAHLEKARPDFFALLRRIDAHERVRPVFAQHWDH